MRVGLRLLLPLLALALPLFALQDRASDRGAERSSHDEGGEELEDRLRPLPPSPAPERQLASALVADESRERGAPFLVPLADGRAWLGCLEWEAGAGDRVAVRELAPDGAVLRTLVVSEAPAEIVRPVGALDGQGRLHVFWTELVDGAPQLRFARLEGERFTAPVTLTSGPHPNSNVEAALHGDGRIWLAWESFLVPDSKAAPRARGSVDVVLAPLDEPLEEKAALGEVRRIGDGEWSDVDPVIVSRGTKLHVAWSSYGGRDYDVLLRSFDSRSGELAPPLDVTADGTSDDLHPALAATSDDELWVAWDRLVDSTRGSSIPETLRSSKSETHDVFVMTARVRGAQVELPVSHAGWPAGAVAGAARLSWMGGVPRLAVAADGRPWIAYRYLLQFRAMQSRGQFFGEPVLVHSFGALGWSHAIEIEESLACAEEPALCAAAAGVLCAGQQDRRQHVPPYNGPNAPKPLVAALGKLDVDVCSWFGPTGIFLARLEPPAANATSNGGAGAGSDGHAAPVFVPRPDRRAEQHFHPNGDAAADPVVSGAEHHEIRRGEQRWSVYWGDLHRHSSISRCARGYEPVATQRYEFGRDVHLYDFMAMTDHAGQIDPFSWWQLDKMCWLFRNPNFSPLAGFECSTQWYGHQNVILDGRLAPLFAWAVHQQNMNQIRFGGGLELLYRRLPPDRAISIPHTSADGGRRVPFDQCDPKFVKLIEVYQALRGNYEFEGCLRQSTLASSFGGFAQDALELGMRVGFVASTDHGNGASYAGVLAESLDPHAIFTALRSRRTFGSTTKGLLVDLRVGDAAGEAVMGEEIACAAPVSVRVKARAVAEIAEVVVFKDGKPWRSLGRGGTQKPESLVGVTVVLDPPFKARAPDADWSLTLTVDDGEWLAWPLGRKPPQADDGGRGFSVDGKTLRFSWPAGFFGFRTGDLRVRLLARRDAHLVAESGGDSRRMRLTNWLNHPLSLNPGKLNIVVNAHERWDDVVDLDKGLGVRELEQEWTDEAPAPDPATKPSWYYARVVQRDGEMAWSSPIFVTPQLR